VVFFAGLIGDSFGFGIGELILMALVMAVAAGASAILTGLFQDRVGHRRTIMMVLGVWVLASAGLGLMQVTQAPRGWFWVICAGVGFGLGGIGTSSRALVGVFTPEQRSAEFFGLWGMVYKLASIGGVLFGVAGQSSRYGLFLITGFFGAGLALMMLVDPRRGMDEARAAEGEAGVA
jgi:UMF1 family MFS transporter